MSGVQRKVFRIEELVRTARAVPPQHSADSSAAKAAPTIYGELAAIQDAIARNKRELSALINNGNERRMSRAAGELGAAVEGMEKATQKILASAEAIDECARALASALTDDYHHGLAQDVQDHVVRVYEACNFQDLAGQRIGKVIATLIMVEEQLAAMIERCQSSGDANRPAGEAHRTYAGDLINGPRLDGDTGHVNQQDIDAMFA
jgi:chemotaxis protein CheZ